jgi:hypothetical protein
MYTLPPTHLVRPACAAAVGEGHLTAHLLALERVIACAGSSSSSSKKSSKSSRGVGVFRDGKRLANRYKTKIAVERVIACVRSSSRKVCEQLELEEAGEVQQ